MGIFNIFKKSKTLEDIANMKDGSHSSHPEIFGFGKGYNTINIDEYVSGRENPKNIRDSGYKSILHSFGNRATKIKRNVWGYVIIKGLPMSFDGVNAIAIRENEIILRDPLGEEIYHIKGKITDYNPSHIVIKLECIEFSKYPIKKEFPVPLRAGIFPPPVYDCKSGKIIF